MGRNGLTIYLAGKMSGLLDFGDEKVEKFT